MKLNKIITFLICSLCFVQTAFASQYEYCKPTKATLNDYEPEHFITSNNLLKKAGQTAVFCGERIIIYGRLTDNECRPISDAKIYLWQVNCQGKYPYTPLRNRIDNELIDSANEQSFTGNGVATTNTQGEFVFVTTYPNKVHGKKAHVNIRAEHYQLGSLQTTFTLSGNKIYNLERVIEDQGIIDFAMRNGTSVYGVNITMPPVELKTKD